VVDCVRKGDGSRSTGEEGTDAIWEAKKRGKTEVATLLERFKENPEETRNEVRKRDLESQVSIVHPFIFHFS